MLTISISSYTQGQYLREAIESALRQTVPCLVIVVDDGSTDDSLEIAKQYPVKVISQVNKGLSSARNTGLMNCETDWILFLDADDILLPQCVEYINKQIKYHGADVIGLSFKEFGIRNNVIQLMPNPTIEDFKTGNRIGYCSAIKTSVLREIGGYSPKMVYGYEDYAIWFDLLLRGKKIVTIPEILWLYRTKERSMINDAMEHHNELVAQINKDFNVDLPEIKTPLPQ